MRTISAAMTWELLARGRWTLTGSAIALVALPMLVLFSLSSVGALNPDDVSVRMLHFLFMQANIFTLVTLVLALNAEQTSRLFALPARSTTLVAWRIIPNVLVVTADVAAWTALLNAAFGFDWPLWGPAFLAACAVVGAHASFWICFRSRWMVVSLTILAAVCSFWFKSQYGPLFGELQHAWIGVAPIEIVTLILLSIVAYWLAVVGFARSRRGEPPVSLGLIARLNRHVDAVSRSNHSFRNPLRAQTWYFRQQGWAAPIAVAGFIAVSLTIWSLFNRDPRELIQGFAFSCGFVWIAGLLGGVLLGAVGSKGDVQMGQFLATRPVSSADMARILLRIAGESLLVAWLIWGGTLLLILLAGRLAGYAPLALFPPEFNWQMLAGGLLTSWGVFTNMMSIVLIGRGQLVARILASACFAYIGVILCSKHMLEPATHALIMQILVALFGVACSAATVVLIVAVRRRRMIAARALAGIVAAWLALIVIAMLVTPADAALPLQATILLYGSLGLAVAPFAAVPLALAWNRTR